MYPILKIAGLNFLLLLDRLIVAALDILIMMSVWSPNSRKQLFDLPHTQQTDSLQVRAPWGPETAWARRADMTGQKGSGLDLTGCLHAAFVWSHLLTCTVPTTMATVFGDNGDELDCENMIDK